MDRAATQDLILRSDPVAAWFVAELLPRIVRAFSPAEVWIFGSRARRDAMEYSDLDVIVVAEAFSGTPWIDRAARALRESASTGGVEFLCYTPAEFGRKREEIGIVAEAVREGFRVV